MKLTCLIIVCVTLSLASHVARADGFVHPGVLHSKEDLERMKAKVSAKAQPWLGGFDVLASSKYASADYRLRGPVTNCTIGGGKGQYEIRDDSSAAYCNALMWYIIGEKAHLQKAKQIINAWSGTMQTFDRKDNLSAGMSAQKFATAGEILRYTKGADWSEADILACEKMFRELLLPAILPTRAGNQGALCLTGEICIGVFCNDRKIVDHALETYLGNYRETDPRRRTVSLRSYVFDNGQSGEAYRDQPHPQGGIAHLAEICQTAEIQGIGLWGAYDNLLLKAFEYIAKYNLGEEVPFEPYTDGMGQRRNSISESGRGRFSPIYEMVAAYGTRRGLDVTYTRQVTAHLKYFPETGNADHPGFGALTYRLSPVALPSVPKDLAAFPDDGKVKLSWSAVSDAASYSIKCATRSTRDGGLYTIVAKKVETSSSTCVGLTNGTTYYYVVSSENKNGESANSAEVSVTPAVASK